MLKLRLLSCIGVDFELALLPHFLKHYLSLGVLPENFSVILHSSAAESPALDDAKRLLGTEGIKAESVWIGEYSSREMWARRRAVQRLHADGVEWVLNADLDELHEYPDSLSEVVHFCDRHSVDVVQGPLIDRLAADGCLNSVASEGSIWTQFPLAADVMCSMAGTGNHHGAGGTVKAMLHRATLPPSIGGHAVSARIGPSRFMAGLPLSAHPRILDSHFRFRFPFQAHHFKWTTTVAPSLQRRLASARVTAAGREYGTKILDLVSENSRLPINAIPTLEHSPGSNATKDWKKTISRIRRKTRSQRFMRTCLRKTLPYRVYIRCYGK